MKLLITLDYELFLGSKTGTVEKCLIEPMDRLIEVGDKYSLKYTIFVDSTYLLKLRELSAKYSNLKEDYLRISEHIKFLHKLGHDIQLHIHPHWHYSEYNGKEWLLDKNHYKLSDLSDEDARMIFSKSKQLLDEIIGEETIAFRAGGFSAQTNNLITLFEENNIKVDSSVYPKNLYDSSQQMRKVL